MTLKIPIISRVRTIPLNNFSFIRAPHIYIIAAIISSRNAMITIATRPRITNEIISIPFHSFFFPMFSLGVLMKITSETTKKIKDRTGTQKSTDIQIIS